MFTLWDKQGAKQTVIQKKQWRDSIRVWLLKRVKLELNLGLAAKNPHGIALEDDKPVHEALHAAGKTIVPCLTGNHTDCELYSSGCCGADTDFSVLPSKTALTTVPRQTVAWLKTVVDAVLGSDALKSLVVNGRKATTSLVESVHREIRLPIPKGRMHPKNETALIKSGRETVLA